MNKTLFLGLLTFWIACGCTGESTTSARDDAGVDASSKPPNSQTESDEGERDDEPRDTDDQEPDDAPDEVPDDAADDEEPDEAVDADVPDDQPPTDTEEEVDAAPDDATDDEVTDDDVTDDLTDDEVTDDLTDDDVTDDLTDDDDEVVDDLTDDEVTDDLTDDDVTDDLTDDDVSDDVTDDLTDDEVTDDLTDDDVTDGMVDASVPDPVEAGPEPPNYNPCISGTWDHDTNPETPCQAHEFCLPGEFVVTDPTPTSDRECRACTLGTFSTVPNATGCSQWSNCLPGQTQALAGSATNDRTCSGLPVPDCATGTWDHDDNLGTACVPHTNCPMGQYIVSDGSATSDRQCAPCAPESFAGSSNSEACTPWRVCGSGQYVLFGGSASADRTCAGCPSGSFNISDNALGCTVWSSCPPGTFVDSPGSARQDRVCEDCPDGMSTPSSNQMTCVTPEDCAAGTVTVGVDAGFPICEGCMPGEYCAGADAPSVDCGDDTFDDDNDSSTPCAPKLECVAGYEIDNPGSAVEDRTCLECDGEVGYTDESNTDECLPHSVCGSDEFQTAAGTQTSDTVCVPLIIEQIVAGGRHTCVRLNDGNVRCWGDGGQGQLGYGNNESLSSPGGNIGALELSFVTQISAGTDHTCAVLRSGGVRCWGSGGNGRLGYDDQESRQSPGPNIAIPVDSPVQQVVAGASHTCALLANGSVSCWGSNELKQLGYPDAPFLNVPGSPVLFGEDEQDIVMELAAGGGHTCALFDNGTVRCTGINWSGEAGYQGALMYPEYGEDLQFGDGASVSRIAVNDGAQSCVIISGETPAADTLRCWGWGNSGRLGYSETFNIPSVERPLPMLANVPLGGAVSLVAAGDGHSCAWLQGGGLRCWGRGDGGRLGYGSSDNVGDSAGTSIVTAGNVNLSLPGGVAVKQIAVSGDPDVGHTCVLLTDGNVRCWGYGIEGQLGYGDNASLSTPGGNVSFSIPVVGDAGL